MLRVLFLKEAEIGYFLICRKLRIGQRKLSRKKALVLFVCWLFCNNKHCVFFFIEEVVV